MSRDARLPIALLALMLCCQAALSEDNEPQPTMITFSAGDLDGKPRVKVAFGDIVLLTDSAALLDSSGRRTDLRLRGRELEVQDDEDEAARISTEVAVKVWDKAEKDDRKTKASFSVKSFDGRATLQIVVGDVTLHAKSVVAVRPNGKQVTIGLQGNDVQIWTANSQTASNKMQIGIWGDALKTLFRDEVIRTTNAKPVSGN